jgi:hypothetical protein
MDMHSTKLTLAIYGVQIGVVENQHSPDREEKKRYAGRWTLTFGVIVNCCVSFGLIAVFVELLLSKVAWNDITRCSY